MAKLTQIEGIGKSYAEKLRKAGVRSTEALLKKGATSRGRKEIAEKSRFGEKLILGWVNRADLFRIKGVGEEYSDLLEAAGVDTVRELAQRNAENLCRKMAQVNKKKKLVRALPTPKRINGWIKQAKKLPRIVRH
jgi:predicted flap endonuclease-1-like 5' DNA nuclease